MNYSVKLRCAASVVAILSAGAAMADVSAADVWAEWQNEMMLYADSELTTGSEVMSGDTLTITDLKMDIDGQMSIEMGTVTFTENGDGTVSVVIPQSYPILIQDENGESATVTITQSDAVITASGTADALAYDFQAGQVGITLGEITADGVTVDADIRIFANNASGSSKIIKDDGLSYDYDFTADSIDVLADFQPDETSGDYLTLSGKIEDLTGQAAFHVPEGAKLTADNGMLDEGVTFEGGYTYDAGAYIFEVSAEGENTAGSVSTGAGFVNANMDSQFVEYDAGLKDMAMTLSGAGLPFPINISLANYGFGLAMPLDETDEPADLGLRLNLTDLAIDDMIWSMFDPAGALPHDPATLDINLSGKGALGFSMADLNTGDPEDLPSSPGELNAVTLNGLTLKLAGAMLTGTGDFTFDNTDLETFDGFPRPAGEATFTLNGANALIDALVQMGFVPEDQAMMGRMMMGMFAKATGEDELTSKIEITNQGSIIANGQRIR